MPVNRTWAVGLQVVAVAVAPVPGPPKLMVGLAQFVPGLLMATPVTEPEETKAVATGAVWHPVNVTAGAVVYPLPPLVTLMEVMPVTTTLFFKRKRAPIGGAAGVALPFGVVAGHRKVPELMHPVQSVKRRACLTTPDFTSARCRLKRFNGRPAASVVPCGPGIA